MAGAAEEAWTARCWLLHAFDVARAISLPACRRLVPTREVADTRRAQWPHLFGLRERPLVWDVDPVDVSLGGRPRRLTARAILYDFGNVSVQLGAELTGPPSAWPELAAALDGDAVHAAARGVLARLLALAGPALRAPHAPDDVELYAVWQLDAAPGDDAAAWVEAQAPLVARLLRGEVAPLARDEVAEALARRLAYRPDDVVVVDVDAALIVDRAHDDTLAVLDFANCEHLALRTLDDELDAAVAGASALLGSRLRRLRTRWSPGGRALRRLTELTLAAAAELEAVDNAIKLTGDHYLARVYRLAVDRFHLRPFREGIARKLATLWELQRVLLDQAAARRAELLEWIIIALIAVELARSVG